MKVSFENFVQQDNVQLANNVSITSWGSYADSFYNYLIWKLQSNIHNYQLSSLNFGNFDTLSQDQINRIFDVLAALPDLQTINIMQNFTAISQDKRQVWFSKLDKMTKLTTLNWEGNIFNKLSQDEITTMFSKLKMVNSFKILNLANQNLGIMLPEQIKAMRNAVHSLKSIDALDLSNNHLSSIEQLPLLFNNLSKLSNLCILNLANNHLKNSSQLLSMFDTLTTLSNLHTLDVSNNNLGTVIDHSTNTQRKTVFASLSSLPNLEILNLSYNDLNILSYNVKQSLCIALKRLPKLSTLDIAHNMLWAKSIECGKMKIMESLLSIRNLHTLNFTGNRIQDILSIFFNAENAILDSMSNLHTLNLENNRIQNILSIFFNAENAILDSMSNLHTLNLANNNINSIPSIFGNAENAILDRDNMSNLHTLNLANNNINSIPSIFGNAENAILDRDNMSNLHTLNLTDNICPQVTRFGSNDILNLHTLNLAKSNLGSLSFHTIFSVFFFVKKMINLHTLDLSQNDLYMVYNQGTVDISYPISLQVLSLASNNLNKSGNITKVVNSLKNLINLHTLDLSHNIDKPIFASKKNLITILNTVINMKSLKILNLSHNYLGQHYKYKAMWDLYTKLFQDLVNMPNLHTLDLSNNYISRLFNKDTELDSFFNRSSNLHTLDLSNNFLGSSWYQLLQNQILNILYDVANMPNLHTLDLSFNEFTRYSDILDNFKILYNANIKVKMLEPVHQTQKRKRTLSEEDNDLYYKRLYKKDAYIKINQFIQELQISEIEIFKKPSVLKDKKFEQELINYRVKTISFGCIINAQNNNETLIFQRISKPTTGNHILPFSQIINAIEAYTTYLVIQQPPTITNTHLKKLLTQFVSGEYIRHDKKIIGYYNYLIDILDKGQGSRPIDQVISFIIYTWDNRSSAVFFEKKDKSLSSEGGTISNINHKIQKEVSDLSDKIKQTQSDIDEIIDNTMNNIKQFLFKTVDLPCVLRYTPGGIKQKGNLDIDKHKYIHNVLFIIVELLVKEESQVYYSYKLEQLKQEVEQFDNQDNQNIQSIIQKISNIIGDDNIDIQKLKEIYNELNILNDDSESIEVLKNIILSFINTNITHNTALIQLHNELKKNYDINKVCGNKITNQVIKQYNDKLYYKVKNCINHLVIDQDFQNPFYQSLQLIFQSDTANLCSDDSMIYNEPMISKIIEKYINCITYDITKLLNMWFSIILCESNILDSYITDNIFTKINNLYKNISSDFIKYLIKQVDKTEQYNYIAMLNNIHLSSDQLNNSLQFDNISVSSRSDSPDQAEVLRSIILEIVSKRQYFSHTQIECIFKDIGMQVIFKEENIQSGDDAIVEENIQSGDDAIVEENIQSGDDAIEKRIFIYQQEKEKIPYYTKACVERLIYNNTVPEVFTQNTDDNVQISSNIVHNLHFIINVILNIAPGYDWELCLVNHYIEQINKLLSLKETKRLSRYECEKYIDDVDICSAILGKFHCKSEPLSPTSDRMQGIGTSGMDELSVNDNLQMLYGINKNIFSCIIDEAKAIESLTNNQQYLAILTIKNEQNNNHAVVFLKDGSGNIITIEPLDEKSPFKNSVEKFNQELLDNGAKSSNIIYSGLQQSNTGVCADISLILLKNILDKECIQSVDCIKDIINNVKKQMYNGLNQHNQKEIAVKYFDSQIESDVYRLIRCSNHEEPQNNVSVHYHLVDDVNVELIGV